MRSEVSRHSVSRTLAFLVLSLFVLTAFGGVVPGLRAAAEPVQLSFFGKLSPKVFSAMQDANDGNELVRVLVETQGRSYSTVREAISQVGGTTVIQFKYTPAVAAYVPAGQLAALAQNPSVKQIYLDTLVNVAVAPQVGGLDVSTLFDVQEVEGESQTVELSPQDLSRFSPRSFFNAAFSGVSPAVLAASSGGTNTIIGIIDSGINSAHGAFTPHFGPGLTSMRVIGGRDVSCDGGAANDPFCAPGAGRPLSFVPLPGFDTPTNNFHGSFVAGVAAGRGAVARPAGGTLVRSIEFWTGTTLPDEPPTMKLIPLIGIAPAARLFIIKVFDHTGLGVPTSFIIHAINTAIEERLDNDVDIDIINMSLGGATLFDGQDLEDKTVDFATTQGILSVSAAGNDGPASMTVSSPGSAQTGIAVAAAADPVQVRIRRDQQLGLGNGDLAFVSENTQVIFFSSRGPTSDGRAKPDLIASGTFILQAGAEGDNSGLAFGSGTSFSAPAVAGAAALLNSFAEGASLATTPFDYKEALRGSADASKVPFYSAEARGRGFLNVAGALAHLQGQDAGGKLGNTETVAFGSSLNSLRTIDIGDEFEKEFSLFPGHIREFVFSIPNRAKKVVEEIKIEIEVERLGTNPLVSNPTFGGNAMSIYTQSSKRTTLDAYIDKARVTGEAEILITDDSTTISGGVLDVLDIRSHVIEPGFFKVLVDNDWRSFDKVKFELEIEVELERAPRPDIFLKGNIDQDEFILLGPFNLEKGDVIELSWKRDWSRYPTSDVDMFLVDATTEELLEDFEGATLNAPERVRLGADATLFIFLFGFEINPPGTSDRWELRIFEADDEDDEDDD